MLLFQRWLYHGFAHTGLITREETVEMPTFLGLESKTRMIIPNPWVGPDITLLLGGYSLLAKHVFGYCFTPTDTEAY
jgi:hypothetical protein